MSGTFQGCVAAKESVSIAALSLRPSDLEILPKYQQIRCLKNVKFHSVQDHSALESRSKASKAGTSVGQQVEAGAGRTFGKSGSRQQARLTVSMRMSVLSLKFAHARPRMRTMCWWCQSMPKSERYRGAI